MTESIMEPSKQGSEATQFKPGKSGNPGGLTADERAARDLMRGGISSPEMFQAWRTGYLNQLIAENPIILKDYADRVGGPPKQRMEVSGDPDAPVSPLAQMSLEYLEAIARAQLDKERK